MLGFLVLKISPSYTPEDERLEPENTPLEKENHRLQTIIFRFELWGNLDNDTLYKSDFVVAYFFIIRHVVSVFCILPCGRFQKIGVPQNGWFIMENLIISG